jgi:hypothetical protein
MKKLFSIVTIALLMQAGVVLAQPTAGDVELLVETDLGIGAITTYLEFTDSATGDTREGLSLATGGNDWNYPDGSDGAVFVNANCLDEKGQVASDFLATISGLSANTDYGLYVVAAGRKLGDGYSTYDFSWGTLGDGSPINDVVGVYLAPGAVEIAETGGGTDKITASMAVPIGIFTSDGSGDLSIYVGNALLLDGNTNRTQLDGLVVGEGIP